ncbi:bifunctional D-cysteine desulfhydrase/1-aminocyclopropane-1-carboxylate deaminase, mitochondrial [Populus nigra]|uniref:bifunctional D-cysteine desulfhydrase/1-aminocyclopropane-1-carboxylate deaminase, mitochondrial n=1 Tax=Populus nigra TaxID=3691 RepID=UPI002B272169|nr:bifunctional D-cysteine desulfhydrase/1-aminocyclopropane-1-carboxylate deaminase, mitochondrial [Populus nigra]XP_061957159.1 bifunctional D-cysteine desulfhydrase/1-aminocyclopropane-1-carboxylate deaminase, mitochondrial [Populus nigra]XP_061957160.1 bifunctional D-cysteine desulfhydrase/1-aminocyclopropane-1-carboxylate deaminase, mitochondrial [Populus nigra]
MLCYRCFYSSPNYSLIPSPTISNKNKNLLFKTFPFLSSQKPNFTSSLYCSHPLSQIMDLDNEKDQESRSLFDFLSQKAYTPPSWASLLNPIPSHIFSLGHLPTPIHKWNLPNLPTNTEVYLKRDDLSGMQLSGNKVRKLEFLMADAVAQGADCIITIGGIQSNHCRATAVAAKYLNLDCYVILRTSKVVVDKNPGLTGNLLVERLVGASVQLISKEEYAQIGSVNLTNDLKEKLVKEGRKPYVIPVGGSNSLGTWGYIEAIREIEQQVQATTGRIKFDDIVVACGSGGTIAGLSLGSWLGTLKAKVHAFAVCDDPDYFYNFVQELIDGLKAGVDSHDIVNIQNAKGLGYAINTPEELKFVKEIATATGVVLDPVYSGKAAYGMMKDMAENPKNWEGRKVLFIHTGGLLGLFDKVDQMSSLVENWGRMEVQESVPRKDGIGKMF